MTQSPGSEGVYGVIPARYASSRFPGKPLAPIDGTHMFWDYDAADRAKAREISHQYLQRRLAELKAGKRNVKTWQGQGQTAP